MRLFMVAAGLASVYDITTFGPKLFLQNKVKVLKAKNERANASTQQPNIS
jgi:hypothetical protein